MYLLIRVNILLIIFYQKKTIISKYMNVSVHHAGRSVRGGKDNLKGYPSNDEVNLKGDLLIIDLWT